jgi:hypothetical protein
MRRIKVILFVAAIAVMIQPVTLLAEIAPPYVLVDELNTGFLGTVKGGQVYRTAGDDYNTYYVCTSKGPAQFGFDGTNVVKLKSIEGGPAQGVNGQSAVRMGDYVYWTGPANGDIHRVAVSDFQSDFTTVSTAGSASGDVDLTTVLPEHIESDGTALYVSLDAGPSGPDGKRDAIAKLSVTELGGGAFSLYMDWMTDTGTNTRFKQPGYNPTDGKVYAHDWSAQSERIYTFDPGTGAATHVGSKGRFSNAAEPLGDTLLLIGQFYANAIDLIPINPDGTLGTPNTSNLFAGEIRGFGATSGSPMNGIFVGCEREGQHYVQYWVPEPATLAVLALGGLAVLFRRR